MYINILKTIYDKPRAKNILSDTKLKSCFYTIRNNKRVSSPTTFTQYNPGNSSLDN